MTTLSCTGSTDALLLPYLNATNETEARRRLDDLLRRHVLPEITAVANREAWWSGQANDVAGVAASQLMRRLEEMRKGSATIRSISDFTAYVRVVARNACRQLVGKRLQEEARQVSVPLGAGEDLMEALVADPRADVTRQTIHRAQMQEVWKEIVLLPQPQRAALLLNLREEAQREALSLLPLLGVASPAQIAEALGLSVAEFTVLAPQLPLDDQAIAERLELTRREVISLRLAARRRLARRLQEWIVA